MSSAETYEHFAVSKAQLEGNKYYNIGFNTGNMGPAHWGLGEIYGLLVHPGEASKLLTDHLITSLSLARKSGLVKPPIQISLIGQGIAIAVGWHLKHQSKQTNKQTLDYSRCERK